MRFFLLLTYSLLLAAAGISQPPWPAEEQTGVIRVSSNLVAVPVSVLDGSGQPVRGLTVKDFKIEEGGLNQRLVWLGDPVRFPSS